MDIRYDKKLATQLFILTNDARREYGVHPLIWDGTLVQAAYNHCMDIAERRIGIYHKCPLGKNVADRVRFLGYDCFVKVSENVSYGNKKTRTYAKKYEGFDRRVLHQFFGYMSSKKGHREGILDPVVTHAGMMVVLDDSHPHLKKLIYTCQIFALPY